MRIAEGARNMSTVRRDVESLKENAIMWIRIKQLTPPTLDLKESVPHFKPSMPF
jgi:hypothetical protein